MKFLIPLLFFPLLCFGQGFRFITDTTSELYQNGQKVLNAWAGGLNSPQFSTIDLNQDGTSDMCLYDRTNQKIYTFLGNSSLKKYTYAPQFEVLFPNIAGAGWLLSYDYDQDGKKDLLVGYNFGVEAYKNTSSPSSGLTFQKTYNLLETESIINSNLFRYNLAVFSTDIPALYDVDSDGDMDVAFLDFHNGLIELHLNKSIERYGNANFLEFERINYCWGDFLIQEINCDDLVFNVDCPFNNLKVADGRKNVRHTGSSVLLTDLNGDGKVDLLVSGVSCNKTYVMLNIGSNKGAIFNNFTTQYPPSKPIDMGVFTALYTEDVNFDGKKDLLVSSNIYENDNNLADFTKSVWIYHDQSPNNMPNWQFQQTDFMQHTMLDVGQSATPTFIDIDADNDLDMIIGNSFEADTRKTNKNQPFATLRLYINNGNAQKAAFELQNPDYLELSQHKFLNILPQALDINRDGSTDLIFTATDSLNKNATIYFYVNQASKNQSVQFNQLLPYPLVIEKGDKPYFYDLDKDGDLDILLCRTLGNIIFLEQKNAQFIQTNATILGIQISATGRNVCISIADYDQDGKDDLVFASNQGILQFYTDIRENYKGNPIPTPIFLETSPDALYPYRVGASAILTTADLNGDKKPDLIAGLYTGGILLFQNNATQTASNTNSPTRIFLKPNPTTKYLYIDTSEEGDISIFSIAGQILVERNTLGGETYLQVDTWATGMYIVQFRSKSGRVEVAKFIKTNN